MANKKRIKILLWIMIPLCVLAIVTSILIIYTKNDNNSYKGKYQLNSCDIIIQENNTSNSVKFDSKYEVSNMSIYFNTKTTTTKTIDKIIDAFYEFENLSIEKNINKFPRCIYANNNVIFNSWVDKNDTFSFSMPDNASKEEILAWLLYFSFQKNNDLNNNFKIAPYGLYAGISSYWLQMPEYKGFVASSIENTKCLTELQFPLYEQNNLPEQERTYAWSFSTYLVESMISQGKTENEIITMDRDTLDIWLKEYLNISLPYYSFEPYSTQYEYRVTDGCFTYYINKEYNDLILPTDVFSTKYTVLADWLKDNEKTTKESDNVFQIDNMYSINVYLDDGLKSTGITGYAYGDYINIYSVGSLSHEYIHHILFYLGQSGNAREVIPEMHANTSKYAMAMWYYLFSGQAKNFPYNKEVKEKETYIETLKLYKKYNTETPAVDNFNFWLFADCFSAIYTEKGTAFIHRVQTDSLAYYIARVYGANYVWQINMNTQIVIEGKPYLDVVDEWYNYIKSIKQ